MGGYDLPDLYLPLLNEEETRGGKGITAHASTAVTTSSMAVLPDETKLIIGDKFEVILTTFNTKLVIIEHSYTIIDHAFTLKKCQKS